MITDYLNSFLENLEIEAKNICIKITTYETLKTSISKDNPTITTLVSKISFVNSNATNPSKLFLLNKQLEIENFHVKVSKTANSDENVFFESCAKSDEKQIFKYLCDSSSIFSLNYRDECSLLLKFSENFNSNSNNNEQGGNEKGTSLLVTLEVGTFEAIINPFQLQLLLNFLEACQRIFFEAKQNIEQHELEHLIQTKKKENIIRSVQNQKIKIFNTKITNITVNFKLDLVNMILLEKNISKY